LIVSNENALSLGKILALLRYRWVLPVALTLSAGAISLAWGLLATKIYRVEAVLAPISQDELDPGGQLAGQFAGVASLLGVNLGGSGRSEEIAIATLQSRRFTMEFLESESLLSVLFANRWDAQAERWQTSWRRSPPTLASAVDYFSKKVRSIRQDRRTGLVHLTIEWHDAAAAASWANSMVHSVNERLRAQAIAEAERSIAYLTEEAVRSNIVGVQQAAYSLIENQLNRITLAKVREEYAFRVVDPAIPPDARAYIRPRLMLLVPASAGLGLFVGVLLILLRHQGTRS
jgi:uncharacterized protein involved in exopolysaccharide biosynthesis